VKVLRLRTRLMGGFAVMAALVIGFTGYTLIQEERMREQVQYMAGQQADVQNKLHDLRETLNMMQQNALQGGINRDRKLLLYATAQAATLFEVFDELRADAESILNRQDRETLLAFLDSTEELYRKIMARSFITLGEMVSGGVPEREKLDRLRLDSVQLNSAFASYLTQMRGDSAIHLQEFEEDIASMRTIGLVAAMGAVLAMILFFFLMQRYLSRPLQHLDTFVAEIRDPTAMGRRASVDCDDEIGAIATALNNMLDGLRETAVSRDHFNHVIANLSNVLIVVDRDGMIDTVNAAACAALGCNEIELLGRRAAEVLPEAVFAMVADGTGGELETELACKGGKRIPMLISAARLPAHEGGWVITGTDITERKKAEDEIRRMLDQQVELNEMKTHFVSMTSHEFRTPLATILSSIELIRDYADRLSAQERNDLILSVTSAVKRMVQMLDNVLVIGRADSRRLEFHPTRVEVEPLCRRIAEEAAMAVVHNNRALERLKINASCNDATALLDEKLLRYILGNLVSNAFKYSHPGGEVTLEVHCLDDCIRLVVQDQGIGIPEEHMPHLYETFRRASNVGNIAGTGLGLAIVKRSVDLHNGHIEVSSVTGNGTRFQVDIPR